MTGTHPENQHVPDGRESRYRRTPTPDHDGHQGKHRDGLIVVTPTEPPSLTRPAAQALLRIILAAGETRRSQPPPEPTNTRTEPEKNSQS